MDKKYYTPEIEEFHVGFEYERRMNPQSRLCSTCKGDLLTKEGLKEGCPHSGTWSDIKEYEWRRVVFQDDDLGPHEYDMPNILHYDNFEFRVKYLDREDIESLGWKRESFGGINFFLEKYTLKFNFDLGIHPHVVIDRLIWIGDDDSEPGYAIDWDNSRVFKGYIKNKSELKKIMQQTSII